MDMDLICLNYILQWLLYWCHLKPTTPEGCDWPIKMQQKPEPSKIWQEEKEAKGEQGPARTTRKQPSQTAQKWWAPVWMKDEKIQSCRCKSEIGYSFNAPQPCGIFTISTPQREYDLQMDLHIVQHWAGHWATPFKIHTPPVEDFDKVYHRGVWIFQCTHLLCDSQNRLITEGVFFFI